MKRVLVFPCGSEIGLEINRSLAKNKTFELFGASSVKDHGIFVYKNYIGGVPNIEEENCIDFINQIIDIYNIDFIFPAHDSVVLKFSEYADKLNATVVTSNFKTCSICRSKRKTYDFFVNLLPVPKVINNSNEIVFPLFTKPDVGQGARGAHKISNYSEYNFFVRNRPEMILTEYLPGKEYTVDCFTDRKGRLLFCRGRARARISNGISVNSIPVDSAEFYRIANIINSHLKFRGMWFFQLKKRSNDEYVLLEIAPRIAGTMGLFRVCGVNFAELSLYDAMNKDVEIIKNDFCIEIDRALASSYISNIIYDTVYVDLDDTIIINNKPDIDLIRFLYYARNNGKHIVLLTRHNKNLEITLQRNFICKFLFDEIINITSLEKKSQYICKKNAIFIDDSFSERFDVSKNCHIPVFSPCDIEALIDFKI